MLDHWAGFWRQCGLAVAFCFVLWHKSSQMSGQAHSKHFSCKKPRVNPRQPTSSLKLLQWMGNGMSRSFHYNIQNTCYFISFSILGSYLRPWQYPLMVWWTSHHYQVWTPPTNTGYVVALDQLSPSALRCNIYTLQNKSENFLFPSDAMTHTALPCATCMPHVLQNEVSKGFFFYCFFFIATLTCSLKCASSGCCRKQPNLQSSWPSEEGCSTTRGWGWRRAKPPVKKHTAV